MSECVVSPINPAFGKKGQENLEYRQTWAMQGESLEKQTERANQGSNIRGDKHITKAHTCHNFEFLT